MPYGFVQVNRALSAAIHTAPRTYHAYFPALLQGGKQENRACCIASGVGFILGTTIYVSRKRCEADPDWPVEKNV